MKKSFVILTLLLPCLIACKKIKDAAVISFNITNSSQFSIPATAIIGDTVNLDSLPPVSTTSKVSFENNKTAADHIENITLKKLTLSIDQPSTQTFDFITAIEIYISTDSLPKVEIAYLEDVPLGVSSIDLNTTDVKLDEYIKKDSYDMTVTVKIRETTNQQTNITANMTFGVTAKLLN
jgi:hypothetical protein